jgi:flagellar hook-length control protein FliK
VPGSDWLPAADGLVAQTAMLDGAAEVAGVKPPGGAVAGYSRMFSRIQNALSQGGDVPGSVAAATAGAIGAEKKQALAMAAVAAQGPQAAVDSRVLGGALADAGARNGRELPDGQGGAAGGMALDAFAESRVPQRSGSAASGDAGGRPSGDAAWGDWGAVHTGPQTEGVEGAAAFADPTQAGAEEQIADQVAYWVNQKTQNAEMTLDRDGQPVQVTVSLSGSEAHVTFRSDQAQTRELLDSSMSQLRDLLRNEGLVLSGTTVGTTARDGASPNDSGQRQGREGERRAQVVASVPTAVASARHHGGAPDRAVDIFV